MARPRQHSDEAILSAVRDLLLSEGPRGVTVSAVSERSGAPTGTIYHRFGSRADMVAELWIGAIRRLQEAALDAATHAPAGVEQVVAVALATVDFCAEHPDDARLLTLASRKELRKSEGLSAHRRAELDQLNTAIVRRLDQIADGLDLPGTGSAKQRVAFAAVSLPYVAVRQVLSTRASMDEARAMVEVAARAVLAG